MSVSGGVIKKEQVRNGGTYSVAGAFVGQAGVSHSAAPAGPTARLLQQADGTAIVEIVCSCGRRMELRCEIQQL